MLQSREDHLGRHENPLLLADEGRSTEGRQGEGLAAPWHTAQCCTPPRLILFSLRLPCPLWFLAFAEGDSPLSTKEAPRPHDPGAPTSASRQL
ncbi:MAG: hypothetical protein CMM29_00550 [Rhodospirillaceae bacterium]|nr:hypothetical protein [Rhodospirillaceae bacterium]